MTTALLSWLRLARIPTIGPVLIKRALDALGSPNAILEAHPSRLADVEGIGQMRAQALAKAPSVEDAARELAEAEEAGVRIICPEDPEWPPGLRTIPDPPIVLFIRGRIDPHDAVAIGIVGSRKCSFYGREQAERFGALLAGAGFNVVRGGARGIDTGAHLGALKAKGRTIVVQGCGLANTYPPENAQLYDRIVAEDRGAILSELPLHEPPLKENFLPRNRIIAGMSLGVLVIEANLKSGSLTTARLAGDDYNREVFALPGRVDSVTSAGTHHLIKTGAAHLVDSIDDVLDALGDVGDALRKHTAAKQEAVAAPSESPTLFSAPAADVAAPTMNLTPTQQTILGALEGELSIDDLCQRTNLPAHAIMAEITLLQIRGHISRTPGNRIARKR